LSFYVLPRSGEFGDPEVPGFFLRCKVTMKIKDKTDNE